MAGCRADWLAGGRPDLRLGGQKYFPWHKTMADSQQTQQLDGLVSARREGWGAMDALTNIMLIFKELKREKTYLPFVCVRKCIFKA